MAGFLFADILYAMDELEISGKRYISSKRIAKENKYHPDYMGQLIRAGRVAGTKVGRAWYVEEQSFLDYLGKERGPQVVTEPALVAASNVVDAGAPQGDGPRTEQIPSKESVYPESTHVAEVFVPAEVSVPAEVHVPIVEEKIFIPEIKKEEPKKEEPKVAPIMRKPTLTYISDSSPLFPEISKRPIVKKQFVSPAPAAAPVQTIAAAVEIHPQIVEKKGGLVRKTFAIASLTLAAVAIFSVAFFGSLDVNTTVLVEQGKPASVAFSQNKTLCFIFGTCQND